MLHQFWRQIGWKTILKKQIVWVWCKLEQRFLQVDVFHFIQGYAVFIERKRFRFASPFISTFCYYTTLKSTNFFDRSLAESGPRNYFVVRVKYFVLFLNFQSISPFSGLRQVQTCFKIVSNHIIVMMMIVESYQFVSDDPRQVST